MRSTDPSPSPPPSVELLDLLRETFLEALRDPDGDGPSRDAASRLARAAARNDIRSPAQLLPVIRAAWAALPGAGSLPDERRDAMFHSVTSAVIATLYESR